MLFVFRVRGECIVSAYMVLVTESGQRFAKRLLAPRAKQEVGANILVTTTVVMVNGSSVSKNRWKKRTMSQHTFHQLLDTRL